jgi:SAM-dependent methyltransferase
MTLFTFAKSIVQEAEVAAAKGADLVNVLPILRKLSLEDFGLVLISMPNEDYPILSTILPRMASDDIQRRWTGYAGMDLFPQTAAFARQTASAFALYAGRSLRDAKVLDFGCGYGRNMRSMLYFTDPPNLWGIDAWQSSLELAVRDGVPGVFRKSDTQPQALPVGDEKFDLIFAFSVFTHISKETSEAILSAMRKSIAATGICLVTVRPVEFWYRLGHRLDREVIDEMVDLHHRTGYAYRPLEQSENKSYGDASISLTFFDRCGWELIGYDSTTVDPYQIAAILRPV